MKYSKKQICNIGFIYILLVTLAILTILTQFPNAEQTPVINEAMYVFYTLFNGNRVMIFFFIGLIIAIPNIFTIMYFKYFNQGFIAFISTRISYQDYLRKSMMKTFCISCCFYFILNLTILFFIHLLYTPISFHLPEPTYRMFAQHQILNFFCYCSFASIGFGFYQLFLLSLIPFIRNEYLYRAIAFIHVIVSLLVFIVIKPLFMPLYDGIGSSSNTLASIFVPLNLYTPGLFFEENGFLSFWLTLIFYGMITYYLFKKSVQLVMQNG